MSLTEQQAQAQLKYLTKSGLQASLTVGAKAHSLPTAFVYAVASRETNCTNILGDYQNGEAHGVGIMQIDVQNPIARQMRDDGTWALTPDILIDFGCAMLAENIAAVKRTFPDMELTSQLKIAASGYNAGIGRAIHAQTYDGDSDAVTTGRNYGADVIARMAIFADLLSKQVPE